MGRAEDEARWDETLRRIPISRIRPPRFQLKEVNKFRVEYAYDRDNLESAGPLNSILVSYEGSDDGGPWYECIDGWERTTIERDLGSTEINATVRHNVTNQERRAWSIMAQGSQYGTTALQKAQQLRRMIESDPSLTQTKLAKSLGCSTATLSSLLRLDLLIDEAKLLLQRGEITVSNAILLSRIPTHEQSEFLEAAKLPQQEFKDIALPYCQKATVTRRRKNLERRLNQEFVPVERLRRPNSILLEIGRQEAAKALVEGLTPLEAFTEGLRWTLRIDKREVEKQKAAFDKKQKQIREEQLRRLRGGTM